MRMDLICPSGQMGMLMEDGLVLEGGEGHIAWQYLSNLHKYP